jgi:large subunit ribosomal protein L7/L12
MATKEEILESIESMTVLEFKELLDDFKERFDVTAAAPVAMAAAPAGGDAAAEDEQSEFEVVLTGGGEKKIGVIKVVRELTGAGLKDAKDLVDGAPSTIVENASKEDAEKAKAAIEEAGGSAELK